MYDKNGILLWPGYRQAITGTRIVIPKVRLFPFGNGSPGNLQGETEYPRRILDSPKPAPRVPASGKAPKEARIFGGGNHESQEGTHFREIKKLRQS